jgi:hypothetical protein
MLLYHFTSPASFQKIRIAALSVGAVHVSPGQTVNAIWLTTRGEGDAHGLRQGGAFLTDDERREAREWGGELPPKSMRHAKDASIRISVEIDTNDRYLHEWLPWARKNVAPDMMALLHPIGSNLHIAKSWRLYFGSISPSRFVAVDKVSDVSRIPAVHAS